MSIFALLACAGPDGSGPGFADLGGSGTIDDRKTPEVPFLRVGTWNLENFSDYGTNDWRLQDITEKVDELDVDVLAVQELLDTPGISAFEAMVDDLDGYAGEHAAWQDFDTSVGLIYRRDRVQIDRVRELFTADSWLFPRRPLEVAATIDGSLSVTFVVVHLKARDEGFERRVEALETLETYMSTADPRILLLGDMNDNPFDAASENAFFTSFLDREPDYWFLTQTLPVDATTSTDWYRDIDGQTIPGEFLDHHIATGALMDEFSGFEIHIEGVEANEFEWWEDTYSDHFPVVVDFFP